MDKTKQKALEAAGYQIGDAADFLNLSEEERQLVDPRLSLARIIRQRRQQLNLSQKELAVRINSTQPRVAKIENAAPDVSLDQLFRGFFALGGAVADLSPPPPQSSVKKPRNSSPPKKKSGSTIGV